MSIYVKVLVENGADINAQDPWDGQAYIMPYIMRI